MKTFISILILSLLSLSAHAGTALSTFGTNTLNVGGQTYGTNVTQPFATITDPQPTIPYKTLLAGVSSISSSQYAGMVDLSVGTGTIYSVAQPGNFQFQGGGVIQCINMPMVIKQNLFPFIQEGVSSGGGFTAWYIGKEY